VVAVTEPAQHDVPRRVTTLAAELVDLASPGADAQGADDFRLSGRMVSSLHHVEIVEGLLAYRFLSAADDLGVARLAQSWTTASSSASVSGPRAAGAAPAPRVAGRGPHDQRAASSRWRRSSLRRTLPASSRSTSSTSSTVRGNL
jgi:hypothetical protein